MFDTQSTPTMCPEYHDYSIDKEIPGSNRIDCRSNKLSISGALIDNGLDGFSGHIQLSDHWVSKGMRGTATRYYYTQTPGARLICECEGKAFSLLLPMDFEYPGPHYSCGFAGRLQITIDDNKPFEICPGDGREVPLGEELEPGSHTITIECLEGDGTAWAIEGIRAWEQVPAFVCGRIEGDAMLTDLHAEITAGNVSYSKTIRNARTGEYSIPVPAGTPIEIVMQALGWESNKQSIEPLEAGEIIHLDTIQLKRIDFPSAPSGFLDETDPLVLICFAHVNIWGQESAQWLQRRVEWINSNYPHLILDANEVNPVYTGAALARLNAPWLTCDGNHSMNGFLDERHSENVNFKMGPVRVVTAGRQLEAARDWDTLFEPFADDDTLRIICAYEPVVPIELLKKHNIRFYFYGHSLTSGPWHEEEGIIFLRKVDANTFYKVEIGPPFTIDAPINIERHIFTRDV